MTHLLKMIHKRPINITKKSFLIFKGGSMTGIEILNSIIEILVGGLTSMGQAIGGALSSMAQSIFLQGTGDAQTLSTFGVLIIVFAGVSLAFGLTRWVVNFCTSFSSRNR